jgi:hypothetical protein
MISKDIIRMAREAGFEVNFDIWAVSVDGIHINKHLERFAALVAEREREACAKVCEDIPVPQDPTELTHIPTLERCATAIRARGESK